MKQVKYWKVIKDGIDIETANNILKARAVEGQLYKRLGVRLKGVPTVYEYGTNLMDQSFTANVVLHGTWEIVIPDDGAEERLEKLRDIVKGENFLGETHNTIDNMNISDIWVRVVRLINNDTSKYRIIKAIVEKKIYKEN